MYTHSKIFRNIIVCSLLLANLTVLFGQQATVNTTVIPPYDRPFDQLKNQINVLVTNASNTNPLTSVFLRLYIEGDNGIVIQSKEEFVYLDAFDIDEMATITRSGISGHLDDAFNSNNLSFQGIAPSEVYDKGLPAGNYTLCFRLYSNDYEPITDDNPAGCTTFNILPPRAVEPPQLISPVCGNEITTGNNNIVFSWTIPPRSDPSTTDYTLKIIELLPNQDPNQAFLSSTVPAFFEKNVQMQNSILYGPTDPPLESGKRYAWQVIAKNDEFNTAFENDGRSEVCWFTWKPNTFTFVPLETKPVDDKPSLIPFAINPSPTPRSSVYGKLYYNFKRPHSNLHGGAKPLKGVSVSLVVTYMFSGEYGHLSQSTESYTFEPMDSNQASLMNDEHKKTRGQVLATTTTDAEGNFKFENFINPYEAYGKVESINLAGGQEHTSTMKGDVYRVLRLKVNNQYYLSPDRNIYVKPWESTDLDEVVSLVRSYNLKVIAKWDKNNKELELSEKALNKVEVHVVRGGATPKYIPTDEGRKEELGEGLLGAVIEKGLTETDGSIVFKNLIQHNKNNSSDRYLFIATPNETSQVTFKPLFKRYLEDEEIFPYTHSYERPMAGSNFNLNETIGSDITWNHELKVKEYTLTLLLKPTKPSILGRLKNPNSDKSLKEDKSIAKQRILLIRDKNCTSYNIPGVEWRETDADGKFYFRNLTVGNKRKEYNNPERLLFYFRKGFKPQEKPIVKLNWGMQLPNTDFVLIPDGYISGFVVDEEGNPVKAKINVDGLTVHDTNFGSITTNTTNGSRGFVRASSIYGQVFSFKAPSGSKRKLTVKANGSNAGNYVVLDTLITINRGNQFKNEPLKIVLRKKQKRIRFKVVEYNRYPNARGAKVVPVANARVTLLKVPSFTKTILTDAKGFVNVVFSNNSDGPFTFKIEPPKGKEEQYVSLNYDTPPIYNTATNTVLKNASLKKAAKITGMVTIAGKPLAGAEVSFKGSDAPATTDNDGKYTLKGIAENIGKIVLTASKFTTEGPNIKPKSKEVTIKSKNLVNFNLKYDKEVFITSIFGFDLIINKKKKETDGTFTIVEGKLINIPKNGNISLSEEKNKKPFLSFHNLKIKKTGANKNGVPVFAPVGTSVTLDDKTLDIKVNKTFIATLGDASKQLKLSSSGGKGQIKSLVKIENSSFSSEKSILTLTKNIYISAKEGSTDTNIKALAIENTKKEKLGIVDKNGKKLTYKLGGFNANAVLSKSYLKGNQIVLNTLISTNKIEGLTPEKLEIEAGDLVIEAGKNLKSIPNSSPLKFDLEKWKFESKKWAFNPETGIEIANGNINTGSIIVPVKKITILPDNFLIDDFEVNGLKIGGIAKLNINKNATTSFGLINNAGSDIATHWELLISGSGNSAADFSLPGFDANRKFNLNIVSLLSNGEKTISLDGNNNYEKFYNIIDIQPSNISIGNDYLDIITSTDLGIPRVPSFTGSIRYRKEGAKVITEVFPSNFSIDAPGDVTLTIKNRLKDTEIRNGFFKATGQLTDKEGINLVAAITKTTSKINIVIEPGQNMKLGGTGSKFKDIKGGIELNKNKDWDKLTFSGELDGFKGVGPGQRQTFTVHGAITADDESIDVDNIETPFGDLALTYDIKNSRFLGHLNIDQPLGGMKFKGAVDFLMGSGGWYFMAGGTGTPPGIGEISAGLIVGDSDYLAPDVTDNIMQFAYDKNVPPTIKNGVSGLFFTGQKVLPIINIPDFSINLAGIVKASLGAKAGLDARFWMNFDSGGDEFGIGVMAFAHAYFRGGVAITGTSISADARAELGVKGLYQTKTKTFYLKGCGSISISGSVEQCVPVLGCIGAGFSKALKLNLEFDSSGKKDLSFGFGSCSGADAPLTSDW